MSTRPTSRVGVLLAVITVSGLIAGPGVWPSNPSGRSVFGAEPGLSFQEKQTKQPPAAQAPAASGAQPLSPEEKEILAFDDLYVKDFNAGNAKALVAGFTEDAEVIEEDGLRYDGR